MATLTDQFAGEGTPAEHTVDASSRGWKPTRRERTMDSLRIAGGARLHGTVACSGAKNAALPIMAASLLCEGPVELQGVPNLSDVRTLAQLLARLGVEVIAEGDTLRLETLDPVPTRADYALVSRMRASFCVLGPLLAKRGRAVVSLPGGCNIGDRPVDLHLAGLRALGAEMRLEQGYVIATADELRGAKIDLRGPRGSTVTGTANVLSAAVLARGTSEIHGAAMEPEIVDLGQFLIAAGARIEGLGTDTLFVEGVERLTGASHRIIADRIEAGTLLLAAAATQGTVSVTNARSEHLKAVLEALAEIGADVAAGESKITVHAGGRLRPAELIARPYPGIPTDLQAQFMAVLALADGRSAIADDVFPDRCHHVAELNRLGARVERHGNLAIIQGVHRLSGAEVSAGDLRASAALVIGGLAASGETMVHHLEHLDRGYQRLDDKLRQLGATIERVSTKVEPTRRRDRAVRASGAYV
jgi:UDP-N-acetylglucosamine 1-carboxyvinyltransferase